MPTCARALTASRIGSAMPGLAEGFLNPTAETLELAKVAQRVPGRIFREDHRYQKDGVMRLDLIEEHE